MNTRSKNFTLQKKIIIIKSSINLKSDGCSAALATASAKVAAP
jgi:hypothetical protein